MSTAPKSLSIQDLSGAVNKAVTAAKLKIPAASGPFAYINPGIICGIILYERLAEAQQLAASIAKQASELAGVTMAPVVQEGAVGEQAAGIKLPPNHIICGFKPELTFGIRFQ